MLKFDTELSYRQFFKACFLLIPAVSMYVFTMVYVKMGQNCQILSLFLSLCLGLVYVILLYIVVTKTDFKDVTNVDYDGCMVKKVILSLIYEVRMAIRLCLIFVPFIQGIRLLMLKNHSEISILLVILFAGIYMGEKGLKGYVCFLESIFYLVILTELILGICCIYKIDINKILGFLKICYEGSLVVTVRDTMLQGFAYLIVFSMMEFVMLLYVRVKNRNRKILISSVGITMLTSLFASVLVIIKLGLKGLISGRKNILYIVGALNLPNGTEVRMGMGLSFLLMTYGLAAVLIHIIFSLEVMDDFQMYFQSKVATNHKTTSLVLRFIWGVLICVLYFFIRNFLKGENGYYKVLLYMTVVDLPLSIILPLLLSHCKNFRRLSDKVVCMILITSLGIGGVSLSGCGYTSLENLDYATVVMIDDNEYAFAINTLNREDSNSTYKEKLWKVRASNIKTAVREYNKRNNQKLDLSHVGYIVVRNKRLLREKYPELIREFATKYVEVIYDMNAINKAKDGEVYEYLKTHYRGSCLAKYDW